MKNKIKDTDYDEKDIFRLMDYMSKDLNEIDYDMESDEFFKNHKESNYIDKNIIKSKAFEKIGVQYDNVNNIDKKSRSKVRRRYIKNIAAAIIGVILLGGIFYSKDVIAGIQRIFQYIPGKNIVLKDTGKTDRYILKDIVKGNKASKDLEVISVVVENEKKSIEVSIRGTGKKYKAVRARFKDGAVEELGLFGIGGSENEWHGTFSNEGINKDSKFKYKEGETIDIIIGEKDDFVIPVRLEKANSFERLSELGPTCDKNGVSITAISKLKKDELKINLISSQISNGKLDQYALPPDYKCLEYKSSALLSKGIKLLDNNGKEVRGRGLTSYEPPLSEFYFDVKNHKGDKFKLVIPYITVEYKVDKDIELDVPRVGGKKEYENKVVDLKGYKLKIKSVSRLKNNELDIKLDTNYDESKDESMFNLNFGVHFPLVGEPVYNGGSYEYGENGEIKGITIQLNKKNIDKMILYIEDIITVKRGPWIMEVNKAE